MGEEVYDTNYSMLLLACFIVRHVVWRLSQIRIRVTQPVYESPDGEINFRCSGDTARHKPLRNK